MMQCEKCYGAVANMLQPKEDELTNLRAITQQQAEEIAKLRGDNEQAYISLALENIRTGSIRDGIAELIRQQAEVIAELKRDAERYRWLRDNYHGFAQYRSGAVPYVTLDTVVDKQLDAIAKPMPKGMQESEG